MIVLLWDAPGPLRVACGVSDNHADAASACLVSGSATVATVQAAMLVDGPDTATAELAELDASGPGTSRTAERIRDWLHEHHDQPVGVTDLAAAMNLSVSRVQRICRRHWNQTPMELLRGIRLDHARATLSAPRSGERAPGVAAVAAAAGYARTTRFNAAYRERFGQTPTQTVIGVARSTR